MLVLPNNTYLIIVNGLDNNFVIECPKNTIRNNSNWECENEKENDNKNDKDDKKDKNDEKNDKNSSLIFFKSIIIIITINIMIIKI